MTYRPAPVSPGAPVPAIASRLEPDAIGVTHDVVIGTANAAPAVAVALTLAPLAVAAAYGTRVVSNAWDALPTGTLPSAAAAFLAWIVFRSLQSGARIAAAVCGRHHRSRRGLDVVRAARSAVPFFQISRESASREP